MSIQGGQFQLFFGFKLKRNQKLIDLGGDQFKAILMDLTYVPDLQNHVNYADVSAHELPTANGYTAGGVICPNPTLSQDSGGIVAWDTDNVTFTANGGNLTAKYLIIYDNTAAGKPLVAVGLLDALGNAVLAYDGVSIGITIANIFTE